MEKILCWNDWSCFINAICCSRRNIHRLQCSCLIFVWWHACFAVSLVNFFLYRFVVDCRVMTIFQLVHLGWQAGKFFNATRLVFKLPDHILIFVAEEELVSGALGEVKQMRLACHVHVNIHTPWFLNTEGRCHWKVVCSRSILCLDGVVVEIKHLHVRLLQYCKARVVRSVQITSPTWLNHNGVVPVRKRIVSPTLTISISRVKKKRLIPRSEEHMVSEDVIHLSKQNVHHFFVLNAVQSWYVWTTKKDLNSTMTGHHFA